LKPSSSYQSSHQLSSRKIHEKKTEKEQEDINYEEFPNMQKEAERVSSYLQNQNAKRNTDISSTRKDPKNTY